MPPPFIAAMSFVPSAEEVTKYQPGFDGRPLVCWSHVAPELVEVYKPPDCTTPTSLVPSEEQAMEIQLSPLVNPPSPHKPDELVYTPPPYNAANSLLPSAEQQTERQLPAVELVAFQVTPESVERNSPPTLPKTEAKILLPSADTATLSQFSGFKADVEAHEDFPKLEKLPMIDWPAF